MEEYGSGRRRWRRGMGDGGAGARGGAPAGDAGMGSLFDTAPDAAPPAAPAAPEGRESAADAAPGTGRGGGPGRRGDRGRGAPPEAAVPARRAVLGADVFGGEEGGEDDRAASREARREDRVDATAPSSAPNAVENAVPNAAAPRPTFGAAEERTGAVAPAPVAEGEAARTHRAGEGTAGDDEAARVLGRPWASVQAMQQGSAGPERRVSIARPGDHGSDPAGDGVHVRMVPSGDIVTAADAVGRLAARDPWAYPPGASDQVPAPGPTTEARAAAAAEGPAEAPADARGDGGVRSAAAGQEAAGERGTRSAFARATGPDRRYLPGSLRALPSLERAADWEGLSPEARQLLADASLAPPGGWPPGEYPGHEHAGGAERSDVATRRASAREAPDLTAAAEALGRTHGGWDGREAIQELDDERATALVVGLHEARRALRGLGPRHEAYLTGALIAAGGEALRGRWARAREVTAMAEQLVEEVVREVAGSDGGEDPAEGLRARGQRLIAARVARLERDPRWAPDPDGRFRGDEEGLVKRVGLIARLEERLDLVLWLRRGEARARAAAEAAANVTERPARDVARRSDPGEDERGRADGGSHEGSRERAKVGPQEGPQERPRDGLQEGPARRARAGAGEERGARAEERAAAPAPEDAATLSLFG